MQMCHTYPKGDVRKSSLPPPVSEMAWVGGQLWIQTNYFFTPYLHQVQYEGVHLEWNDDQTLGELQSPMKEYDIE